MEYTPNYELRKPDETDVVDVQDLNYNADIIDLELKALDDKLAETADVIDQELEALDDKIASHLTDNANPHNVTKSQLGLSKVENMSATEIRTATNRSLKVEMISSSGSVTPEQGRIIFDTSKKKFFGGTGSGWV